MADLKILYFDIETSPTLGYTWGVWDTNVIETKQDWFMLSFAYKINDGPIKVLALPDYKGYDKNKTDDSKLVKDLWNLFNDSDIIIAHNGDRFDIRKANSRFVVHGLTPPRPYKSVDTLKLARSKFGFDSNRLDSIGRMLNIGRKIATSGKDTWMGCLEGDEASWKLMKKYNKQDVQLLYDVYMKLRPWATTHPNLATIIGEDGVCPKCRGELQKRGYGYTLTMRYQRYQCKECHSWSRGAGEKVTDIR